MECRTPAMLRLGNINSRQWMINTDVVDREKALSQFMYWRREKEKKIDPSYSPDACPSYSETMEMDEESTALTDDDKDCGGIPSYFLALLDGKKGEPEEQPSNRERIATITPRESNTHVEILSTEDDDKTSCL